MALMWRYYQTTHNKHETWKSCTDDTANTVATESATHMSMLAVDTPDMPDLDYDTVKYFGDMVIDIDNSSAKDKEGVLLPDAGIDDGLIKSIEAAQLVMEFLEAKCDPNHILIYASGAKGFHLHIPWQLIHPKRRKAPIRWLGAIYRAMALQIQVETGAEGIDYSLYAGRRGHLVRIPNKQRPDGAYKVQISYTDLKLMTPEKYRELCSGPRPALQMPDLDVCLGLRAMFDAARIEVERRKAEQNTQINAIPEEMLEGFGTDEHPECVKRMLYWKHARQGINYNGMSVQLAIYLQAAHVPKEEQDRLVHTFAEHGHSSTYSTPDARRRHVTLQVAPSVKNKGFSCSAMRGHLNMEGGCSGCPVQTRFNEDVSNETGILEEDGCYFMSSGDGAMRKLTNFTIEVKEFFSPSDHEGRLTDWWDGGVIVIMKGDVHHGDRTVSADLFNSAKTFTEELTRFREGTIEVTDRDVKKLRDYILAVNKGKRGMKTVNSVGLRRMKYVPDDSDGVVESTFWVEPGWSCSSSGLIGSVKLDQPVRNIVKHERTATSRVMTEEYEKVVMQLLGCTDDWVVGLILGWVGATQVKEHIMEVVQEFPLLHLIGIAGSGKTSMAKLFSSLGSADYFKEAPQGAPNMSPYPLRELAWESTSVPRILDEVNKPIIQTAKWAIIREVLKACYQQSTMSIGGLKPKKSPTGGHGVMTYTAKATSPIIYLSTSATDEAELWERSVEVHLNKSSHHNPSFAKNYDAVYNSIEARDTLFSVGKIVMGAALFTDPASVLEKYNKHLGTISERFEMRTKKAFAYIFLGLEFMQTAMAREGSTVVQDRIEELTEAVREWLTTEEARINKRKSRTEVDNFIERLGQAVARIDHIGNPGLRKGVHYIRNGKMLYLNPQSIYGEYRSTCRHQGQPAMFSNFEQVRGAMTGMNYYLGEEKLPNHNGILQVWEKLDIEVLEGRGHDFSRFEEL